jgi:hypothetical protein
LELEKVKITSLLVLLSAPIWAQNPPVNGPAAKYCILQGRKKPVPCYVVDNIPGKPPRVTVPTHGPIVERFTFAHTKHRLVRDMTLVGKAVAVIAASIVP